MWAEVLVELCRRVRNWPFGWYVVEYEQSGADRAEYGAQALKERIGQGVLGAIPEAVPAILLGVKGVVPEFDKRRTVSSVSATEEIRQTLFSELPVSISGSEAPVPALFLQRLLLGWTHYVTLLSVHDPEACRT